MLKLTIGGKEYEVDLPLKFKTIKRIYPHVQEAQRLLKLKNGAKDHPVEVADCTIAIVSAALSRRYPECTIDFVEDELSIDEMAHMAASLPAILGGSGLGQGDEQGEAAAEEGEASPSTGTLTE